MSSSGDLPSAMQPSSRQMNSEPLTVADTERLLARCGAHPEAPAVQQALANLLDSAAGPPSDQELAGEVAAVAAFMLATGHRGARHARHARAGNRRPASVRRGRAMTAAISAAILLAFSGAAAENALPASIQQMAHQTFDAPAPHDGGFTAPSSGHEHGRSHPVPGASPSPSAQDHRGKAKAVGKTKSPTGSAHAKATGHTVPPGHQKS